MNSSMHQTYEIDLKDLFFVIIRKLGIILLVGIIFAGSLFAFKFNPTNKSVNALDTSIRLDDESDVDYSERVLKVNRAKDIIYSIDAFKNQIEDQRKYMTDSILMQIDYTNEAVTTTQLYVSINDSLTSGIDRVLLSSYSQHLISGEYLAELANSLGTEQGYLKELIKVDYATSSSVYFNSESLNGCTGTITISVIGPDISYTDKIMDSVIEEVNLKQNDFNASIVSHSVFVTSRQNYYMLDTNTRDLQYNATNRFEILQKQILTYEASLDDLASKMGVGNKENIYSYFSYDDDSWISSSSVIKAAIKYALIGFVFGAFIVVFVILVIYLFGKKFSTQASFFGRFPAVNKIGVVKPFNKRSKFASFFDKKTGDDCNLSSENNYRIIAANIKNLTAGMDKVLLTGTADFQRIKDLTGDLNIKADVKKSFFIDPDCLASISEYDGVIIVEQRCFSDCRLITEELMLIANSSSKLVGAIII